MAVEYQIGEELDDIQITWNDSLGGVRQFATGWTFELKIGALASAALVTKTTNIVGANTAPNVTISWAAGELDTLPAGTYTGQLKARRTADSKDLIQQFPFTMTAVVT
jgi:hypothetical protein